MPPVTAAAIFLYFSCREMITLNIPSILPVDWPTAFTHRCTMLEPGSIPRKTRMCIGCVIGLASPIVASIAGLVNGRVPLREIDDDATDLAVEEVIGTGKGAQHGKNKSTDKFTYDASAPSSHIGVSPDAKVILHRRVSVSNGSTGNGNPYQLSEGMWRRTG